MTTEPVFPQKDSKKGYH